MPRKFPSDLLDHAAKMVREGATYAEAARRIGMHRDNLSKHLRARGIPPPPHRGGGYQAHKLPDQKIIARYERGESELSIALSFDVSRQVIRRRLLLAGIEPRGQSAANIASMRRMTAKQRKARAKAANDALRGSKQPVEGRRLRAIHAETSFNDCHVGFGEEALANRLRQLGAEVIRQKACDVYSLDLFVNNVAVELKSGKLGGVTADIKRGKVENVRNAGIPVIYVVFESERDLIANAEYILAKINEVNRNPPSPREYWVIRSRFENFTRFRNKAGQWACIPSAPQLFASCRKFNF